MAWSLLFIFLLYFSAPAYAAFSKLEVYTNIIGRDLTADPTLAVHMGRTGLIQICGKNAVNLDAASPRARRSRAIPACCASRTSSSIRT